MTTDFIILCADTVPENYTWDLNIPLETALTNTIAYNTTEYVSGYAPAVRVNFLNTSISELDFDVINFAWNFGDYYHDTNNTVSLSCTSLIQHTYIMPGTYTVTLIHTQTKSEEEQDITGITTRCKGKYDKQWIWDSLSGINCITWDETKCDAALSKWWDDEGWLSPDNTIGYVGPCFEKDCKFWSWYSLAPRSEGDPVENVPINPVRWSESATDGEFEKLWMFEPNDEICGQVNQKLQQTVIKTAIVEVKEIMPKAGMSSITQPQKGPSPLTVQLSPRHCLPGSFPIDRIDWDFGDGTPIKTITRYAPPSGADIVNNQIFGGDVLDVRNYDVLHTYIRNKNEYPMFYPSLTCYSASTNSTDSCCITIGPVELTDVPDDLHLLKTRNTLKGNIHSFINNNSPGLVTTTQTITSFIPTTFRTPPTTIKDMRDSLVEYPGYDGANFPLPYTPDCTFAVTGLPERYLATEDDTPYEILDPDPLSATGVPIVTERDFFIYP